MLCNGRFFLHGLLFILFVYFTFNGIIILKTQSFRRPFSDHEIVDGWKGVVGGLVCIGVGLMAGASLVSLFI